MAFDVQRVKNLKELGVSVNDSAYLLGFGAKYLDYVKTMNKLIDDQKELKRIAQTLGLSEKEAQAMAQAYREGGLTAANAIAEGNMQQELAGQTAEEFFQVIAQADEQQRAALMDAIKANDFQRSQEMIQKVRQETFEQGQQAQAQLSEKLGEQVKEASPEEKPQAEPAQKPEEPVSEPEKEKKPIESDSTENKDLIDFNQALKELESASAAYTQAPSNVNERLDLSEKLNSLKMSLNSQISKINTNSSNELMQVINASNLSSELKQTLLSAVRKNALQKFKGTVAELEQLQDQFNAASQADVPDLARLKALDEQMKTLKGDLSAQMGQLDPAFNQDVKDALLKSNLSNKLVSDLVDAANISRTLKQDYYEQLIRREENNAAAAAQADANAMTDEAALGLNTPAPIAVDANVAPTPAAGAANTSNAANPLNSPATSNLVTESDLQANPNVANVNAVMDTGASPSPTPRPRVASSVNEDPTNNEGYSLMPDLDPKAGSRSFFSNYQGANQEPIFTPSI